MSERSFKIVRTWAPERSGVVRITADEVAHYYRIREIECEIGGRGWEVWKLGSDIPYHVRTSHAIENCTCDCIGFEAQRECRHIAVLLAMEQRGLLKAGVAS